MARRAQHLRCSLSYVREANERATSWIICNCFAGLRAAPLYVSNKAWGPHEATVAGLIRAPLSSLSLPVPQALGNWAYLSPQASEGNVERREM